MSFTQKKLWIFYQKLLWNVRSRLNSSMLWVFRPVFKYVWWKLKLWAQKMQWHFKFQSFLWYLTNFKAYFLVNLYYLEKFFPVSSSFKSEKNIFFIKKILLMHEKLSFTLQIYTVSYCVLLSTVISLYSLQLIAIYRSYSKKTCKSALQLFHCIWSSN